MDINGPVVDSSASTKPSRAPVYAYKRLWVIAAISLILTVGSAFLPITMYKDTIERGDSTGEGCNCSYRFGGFPIPYIFNGTSISDLTFGVPTVHAVTVENLGNVNLGLGCSPSCDQSFMWWSMIVVDFVLLFFMCFTVDRAVYVSRDKRKYWLIVVFLMVYIVVYWLSSTYVGVAGIPGRGAYL